MKCIYFILLLSLCSYGHCSIFSSANFWVQSFFIKTCNEHDVPHDLRSLRTQFKNNLFGQHIAADVIYNAIFSHFKLLNFKKPLVMSFHGANGVGKSYVSRMIAKAFYEAGDKSPFFHFYYGLEHFPFHHKTTDYKVQLKYEIEMALLTCKRSIFVFDGIDHIPEGLLDVLMPFIDCVDCSGKTNKGKSIFIFLTNTGSKAIENKLLEKLANGVSREMTISSDFESEIIKETLQQRGGLYNSSLLQSQAISHYVPFLPLEKHHVLGCIKEVFDSDLNTLLTEDLRDEIFKELTFGPKPQNLFSDSGCKRVAQIAGRVVVRSSFFHNEL